MAVVGFVEFGNGLRVKAAKIVGWEQCEDPIWRVVYVEGGFRFFVKETVEEIDALVRVVL